MQNNSMKKRNKELFDSYAEMVERLVKPGEDIVAGIDAEKAHLLHMAVGLSSEVGELMEIRMLAACGKEVDTGHLVEELGDAMFYLQGLCAGCGCPKGVASVVDIAEDCDKEFLEESEWEHTKLVCELTVSSGKILNFVKKSAVYGKKLDFGLKELILAETGKAVTYVWDILHLEGICMDKVLEENMLKLMLGEKARYKAGSYSDAQALGRSDKEGRSNAPVV